MYTLVLHSLTIVIKQLRVYKAYEFNYSYYERLCITFRKNFVTVSLANTAYSFAIILINFFFHSYLFLYVLLTSDTTHCIPADDFNVSKAGNVFIMAGNSLIL